MKLQKLDLENFQGIKSQSFQFNGYSASIYGDNAVGKTTVYNSVTWLLFGAASTGAKGYTPKTKGMGGEDMHHLEHSVTAMFQTESGQMVMLQKVFHEVYKKKRGNSHEEFDGHTIDYYVDGVPVKEKEYTATVLGFCGGDTEKPKMLTMPDYFPEQMDWQTRRRILLDVCGDISDEEIIASTPELKDLPDFLLMPGTQERYYGIDEYRKIAAAKRKDINKQLEGIPERIDEAEKAIPDTSGFDAKAIDSNIASWQKTITQLQAERSLAASGSTAQAEIQKSISDLTVQIANGRAKHIEAQNARNSGLNTAIFDAQTMATFHRRSREDAETDLRRAKEKLEYLQKRREELITEWRKINAEKWDKAIAICPTCGQALPPDQVDKMRSDFNLSRSNRLAEASRKGKVEASKDMIAAASTKVTELETQVQLETIAQAEAEKKVEELRSQCIETVPYEATEEYMGLTAKIAKLREKMANESQCASEAIIAIDSKISAANAELQVFQQNRTSIAIAQNQRQRIAELEQQEKRLTSEYEETEKGLYLCDLFVKTKVEQLTNRINKKFQRVRFQLFVDQLNGGVKEGCEVLVPASDGRLVPYSYANNAARINAGLEIIATLSEHWGIQMPVFVDSAESVTHLISTGTQTVRLVVSEPDKVLRLEVEA